MQLKTVSKFDRRAQSDAIVIPFVEKRGVAVNAFDQKIHFDAAMKKTVELKDFRAKRGEIFIFYPSRWKESRCIFLGLGKENLLGAESLRKAFAALTKYCRAHQLLKISLLMPQVKGVSIDETLQGVSEGLLLSNYVFDKLKKLTKSKNKPLQSCQLIGVEASKKDLVQKFYHVCDGVNLARDLVNENADTLTPMKLVEVSKNLASQFKKVQLEVLDKKRLEKEKLKLMLAVNRGSKVEPALILLNYKGNPKENQSTVVVGKGITYDSGGLQLKPSAGSIIHMKCDMGGAAAVIGTIYAAAKLDLPINVVGVIAACENMIGSEAYKPGDVYESYFGKTVEILSTDAEGRLVLADALAYAEKNCNPKHMIDLATLTGSVKASLGDEISGLMGNDPKLNKKLIYSGKKSGETVWELPLYEHYKVGLKSKIADLQNKASSNYPAGVIAGLFLQEFIKSTSWAHLDIAGTAYLAEPKDYQTTKATGVGVRLILAFLEELIDSQGEC